MDAGFCYRYPSDASEFRTYNFHRPAVIDKITGLFAANTSGSPRIIELMGEPRCGRHYVLRAAAFEARQHGHPVEVVSLDLDGYEPDQPLSQLVEHLSRNLDQTRAQHLWEAVKRVRVEMRVTPLTFLFASLAVRWDASIEDLSRFLQSGQGHAGPAMTGREQLRRLLEGATREQRLVVHVRSARSLDVALRSQLTDETALNPNLYLALSYPAGDAHLGEALYPTHRVHIPAWTRQEMEKAIVRDFHPVRIPADFLDFLWQSSPDREALARILLRLSSRDGTWVMASVDEDGAWTVDRNWARNKKVLIELARDMFEPVLDRIAQLDGSERRNMQRLLNFAALCEPAVPMKAIVPLLGIEDSCADAFLDRVDALFGEDGEIALFEDCGFSNPGFPPTELVYRFRNRAMPGLILQRCQGLDELALELLNGIARRLRPATRAVASLYLRLAEMAETLGEAERYANLLSWWTSIDEVETLTAAVAKALADRDVSPAAVWTAIQRAERTWPPALCLALLQAYGAQPGGVPSDSLFSFTITKAELLFETGDGTSALCEAEHALTLPLPDPKWRAQYRAHVVAGWACIRLMRLTEAESWFTRCFALPPRNLGPENEYLAQIQHGIGVVYQLQGRLTEAEQLLKRSVDVKTRVLGDEHPNTLPSVHYLGVVYERQGRYAEAEQLLKRVVDVQTRVLGDEHPVTLASVHALGVVYESQGRYDEAEQLLKRAVDVKTRVLGEEHPDTLASVGWLNELHEKLGRLEESVVPKTRAKAANQSPPD